MAKGYRACPLIVVFLVAIGACTVLPVEGQSRTIVVPDDYGTISAAIANASIGDTIYVKSGSYTEWELAINKPITLIGENAKLTTINLQSEKHDEPAPGYPTEILRAIWYDRAMAVRSDNFVLSGFTITTTGGDINITGNRNRVTENLIKADLTVKGSDLTVTENTLSPTGSHVVTVLGNNCNISNNQIDSNLIVYGQRNICSYNRCSGSVDIETDDSYIYSNTLQGVEHGYSNFVISGNNNIISKNTIDGFSYGLKINGANNLARLNHLSNCGVGLVPSTNNIYYGNTVETTIWPVSPIYQIINADGNRSVLVHNNIYHGEFMPLNGVLVEPYTKDTVDYYDNGAEGNYWSNYQGTDTDGDGVGDTTFYLDPHHIDRYPLMAPFNLSTAVEVVPDWLLKPSIHLINPQNATILAVENVTIEFVTNKQTPWIGYSLDGQENTTITGNLTLTDLPAGAHNITVYAKDNYNQECASETVNFTIGSPSEFPIVPIAALGLTLSIVCIGIILYKIKKKR